MKIIVPVESDKETVFKRTGKAPFFVIYEDNKQIDVITNNHAHSHSEEDEHHTHGNSDEEVEHHRQDIQNLKGCDVILAQAIGPNMEKALNLIGLKVQKISKVDGLTASEVVDKFLNKTLKRQNR